MGNLRSVEKALERVGADAEITSDPERAGGADGLILPGVGAFPRAMRRVRELGLDELIGARLEAGVPVLGICLGMQLLFESSTENRGALPGEPARRAGEGAQPPWRPSGASPAEGLGLLPGAVEPLSAPGLKVPHIGWCPVRWERPAALTEGLEADVPFYFVHSFTPRPARPDDVLGTAAYGERFACAVERALLYGVQFHPEKSSSAGLRLLENFTRICASVGATA